MKHSKDNPVLKRVEKIQRQAADPAHSAWVAANAGSGKTHVLTQRVIRLLQQGTPPSRILCLTFTKAAAANMSQRVFDTLARWALLDDRSLCEEIVATGAKKPSILELAAARRLFARTIETPGGLKIQTIHAFCEKLLHLFPFEANMPAAFEVLAPEQAALLMAEARIDVLRQALAQNSGELGATLGRLALVLSQRDLIDLQQEAVNYRSALLRYQGKDRSLLQRKLGAIADDTLEKLDELALQPAFDAECLAQAAEQSKAKNDIKFAAKLNQALELKVQGKTQAAAELYQQLYFSQSTGEIRKKFLSKSVTDVFTQWKDETLLAEAERLAGLNERRRALEAFQRSDALLLLLQAIFRRYGALKRRGSYVDYDDLIERSRRLLLRSSAAWVHYKLDQGIDHVLVDEAQDTSPAQWQIIQQITSEFTAGSGAREQKRTLFAVGDEKQSIYSFQGAEPDIFAEMARFFERKLVDSGQKLARINLSLSFRSSPVLLSAIDQIFRGARFTGLASDPSGQTLHEAYRHDLPGLIEIWPVFEPQESAPVESWLLPDTRESVATPAARLAQLMAQKIGQLIAPGSPERVYERGADKPRPIGPGDILVLVRARNAVFSEIIKALKEADIPVAGADRMALTGHIGVMDLIVAGRVALLPQDDLALASLLKSPLIGVSEEELLALAAGRGGSLWQALQQRAHAPQALPVYCRAHEKISGWQALAQSKPPFEFYMHILSSERGRHDLLARLGPEAVDAVDEFLRLTLQPGQHTPSLARFLAEVEQADIEIKRDLEAAGQTVRVMTVHAAKGLEAKVVFLPDTGSAPELKKTTRLFALSKHKGNPDAQVAPGWSLNMASDPQALQNARQSKSQWVEEEHRRLLYVALTRAEERLYIAAYRGSRDFHAQSWYRLVCDALSAEGVEIPAFWDCKAKIIQIGKGASELAGLALQAERKPFVLPQWTLNAAVSEAAPKPPLSPSRALAAADQPDLIDDNDAVPLRLEAQSAMARGSALHRLLQYLPQVPPAQRRAFGARLLQLPQLLQGQSGVESQTQALLDEALRVIEAPQWQKLFGPRSQAEVALTGSLLRNQGESVDIAGQIDRLAVFDDEIWLADFKSGAPQEPMPQAYALQLALYSALLTQIFPNAVIRSFLIWTQNAEGIELTAEQRNGILAEQKF